MTIRLSRTAAALTAVLCIPLAACGTSGEASDAGGAAGGAEKAAEIPVNVRSLTVETAALSEYLTLSGPLTPHRGADISTEERGVVEALPRAKGESVRRGEVLVRLDRGLLEAEMKSAEAEWKLRRYNEERTRRLFEENQVSRQEMLQMETQLAQAAAAAEVARLRWERALIKAPFDGLVADLHVELGELVAEGTPVARLVDPRSLELEASVSERDVRWVRPDAVAEITADGVAEPRAGEVSWVSFEADPTNGKFRTEIRVDNRDGAFRPGVVARARVVKEVHDGVVVVPRDAILLQPRGSVVFVLEGDRARARTVTVGADQGLMTVVRSGLRAGERIAVRGQRDLKDGSLVSIRQEATEPDGSIASDPDGLRAGDTFTPPDTPSTPEGGAS